MINKYSAAVVSGDKKQFIQEQDKGVVSSFAKAKREEEAKALASDGSKGAKKGEVVAGGAKGGKGGKDAIVTYPGQKLVYDKDGKAVRTNYALNEKLIILISLRSTWLLRRQGKYIMTSTGTLWSLRRPRSIKPSLDNQ